MKTFKVTFKTGNIVVVEEKNVLRALINNGIRNEGILKYEIIK